MIDDQGNLVPPPFPRPPLPQFSEAHGVFCTCRGDPVRPLLDRLHPAMRARLRGVLERPISTIGGLMTFIEGADQTVGRDLAYALAELVTIRATEPCSRRWNERAFHDEPLPLRSRLPIAERWPDDLDPDEWAMLYGLSMQEEGGADPWDSVPEDGADDPRAEGRGYGFYDPHADAAQPSGDAVDPWLDRQIMTVIAWVRTDTLPGELEPHTAAHVADRIGRPVGDVSAMASMVRQADAGDPISHPRLRALIETYGPSRTADLVLALGVGARTSQEDEGLDDPTEVPAGTLTWDGSGPRTPSRDDGPDPLATVRLLLPGGSGSNGKPPIIYTETRLVTDLVPVLQSSPPTLVVLSGNAGDGKTAFITALLEGEGRPVDADQYRNVFGDRKIGGNPYLVVLDGSEDTQELGNDALLDDAFRRFEGPAPVIPDRGTLIAVNKGRLLQYLERRRDRYPFLWRLAAGRFIGSDPVDVDHPYHFIDLNERSMFAPDPETSVFGRITRTLAEWPGWDACASCPAQAACPVNADVQWLRKPRVREQVWRVLAAVDLDDRIHVTARHAVTKLASALVGDHRCPDIRQSVEDGHRFGPSDYMASRLFRGGEHAKSQAASMDRVTATYDPGERSSPTRHRQLTIRLLDQTARRDLAADASAALDVALDPLLESVRQGSADEPPAPGGRDYREELVALATHASRRLYLYASDHDLAPAFPLSLQHDLLEVLRGDDLWPHVPRIIQNLNATLGIRPGSVDDLLIPPDYSQGLVGTGFATLIPSERIVLRPATHNGTEYRPAAFLESWPRGLLVLLRDGDRTVASLPVSFLMFEMLDRAGRGFRPLGQLERGYLVRLAGFYRRAAQHAWSSAPEYVAYRNGRLQARVALHAAGPKFVSA